MMMNRINQAKKSEGTRKRSFGQEITNANFRAPFAKQVMKIEAPRLSAIRKKSNGKPAKSIPHSRSKSLAKHNQSQRGKSWHSNLRIPTNTKRHRVARDIYVRYKDDPKFVTDYVEDMYTHFYEQETSYMMEKQPQIDKSHRLVLVNYLTEVHDDFRLSPETLYLACAILDRYLGNEQVPVKKLQLVGLTCLFVASKYEEIYYPTMDDLFCLRGAGGGEEEEQVARFNEEDVLEMETKILKSLKYQISMPTAHTFLVRSTLAAGANETITQLASYLLEGTLLSYDLLKYKPSQLAAASVFLARRHHSPNRESWSPTLELYTQYKEQNVREAAKAILLAKSVRAGQIGGFVFVDQKYGNILSGKSHLRFEAISS